MIDNNILLSDYHIVNYYEYISIFIKHAIKSTNIKNQIPYRTTVAEANQFETFGDRSK